MLKHCATAEATASFAGRFPDLPGNFRETLGLAVSSIGLGTYLGESDAATDAAYEEAPCAPRCSAASTWSILPSTIASSGASVPSAR